MPGSAEPSRRVAGLLLGAFLAIVAIEAVVHRPSPSGPPARAVQRWFANASAAAVPEAPAAVRTWCATWTPQRTSFDGRGPREVDCDALIVLAPSTPITPAIRAFALRQAVEAMADEQAAPVTL